MADLRRAHAALVNIAAAGVTLDLLAGSAMQLGQVLARCPDPGHGAEQPGPLRGPGPQPAEYGHALRARRRRPCRRWCRFSPPASTSHDLLIADPEGFDLLRLTEGRRWPGRCSSRTWWRKSPPWSTSRRCSARCGGSSAARRCGSPTATSSASRACRRSRRRSPTWPTRSWKGPCARHGGSSAAQRGDPIGPDGQPARFVVLGMGKLGGCELNYSSDIDLIFLYDGEGKTDGPRPVSNHEFFDHLARETRPPADREHRVGHGLPRRFAVAARRPAGTDGHEPAGDAHLLRRPRPHLGAAGLHQGPARRPATWTWATQFLAQLSPWIYRRYLSRADIGGIKALKRRIEQQAHGDDQVRDVKTGHGGIRDIEFVIQFLQLLNGGDLPQLRTGNTLEAMARLEQCGCLTNQERVAAGRELQLPPQDRAPPADPLRPANAHDAGRRRRAAEAGPADGLRRSPGAAGPGEPSGRLPRKDRRSTARFSTTCCTTPSATTPQTEAEADLVLDPDPQPELIEAVLSKYHFRDVKQAYQQPDGPLGREDPLPFHAALPAFPGGDRLSLLKEVGATADPDAALVNLDHVSDSLGGKGVLWELFSFNPPSLRLYVELCAYSPHLSGILISNPGMIDGLMDSLVLDRLPTREGLQETLKELCWAAEDIEPILHSFKNDQQLRVGVRDLLGKEDIQATTGVLSDIAEVCLAQIAAAEYQKLVAKFGRPQIGEGPRAGEPCDMAILALGKFGGREMNYHSDLDIIFLYEADGQTAFDFGQWSRPQHVEPALLQRVGAADHQDGQPLERLGPALRGRRPAAAHRQERLAGHHAGRIQPLLSPKARASFGSGRRCARPGRFTARRGRGGRPRPPCSGPPSAIAGGARTPTKSARCGSRLEATVGRRRSEARSRRHCRHRVPRADAAAPARPQESPLA